MKPPMPVVDLMPKLRAENDSLGAIASLKLMLVCNIDKLRIKNDRAYREKHIAKNKGMNNATRIKVESLAGNRSSSLKLCGSAIIRLMISVEIMMMLFFSIRLERNTSNGSAINTPGVFAIGSPGYGLREIVRRRRYRRR